MQMGQAQELVEALGEAEMGKAFAQPVPAAIGFGLPGGGGHKRREIEFRRERDGSP
jgi:hypothetical protein